MPATISPTEPSFYAEHDSATLHRIVADKTAASLDLALAGADKVALNAMKIANAAWAQLVERGEA